MSKEKKAKASRPVRADAQKSVEQILATAERVLDEDPTASLLAVAAAAGLTRVTIYRHFNSREALLETLTCQAYEHVIGVMQDIAAASEAFVPAVGRLTSFFLQNARRLRVIANQPKGTQRVAKLRTDLHQRMDKLMLQGVAEGIVADDLDAIWVRSTFTSLVRQSRIREKEFGYSAEKMHALVLRTFLAAVAKPPRSM